MSSPHYPCLPMSHRLYRSGLGRTNLSGVQSNPVVVGSAIDAPVHHTGYQEAKASPSSP